MVEGRFIASRQGGPGRRPAVERTAEEEAEVAPQQAEARRQAALAAAEREARIAEARPQSAAETASASPSRSREPAEPGLTPENAENLLDDAAAAPAAELHPSTDRDRTEE